MITFFTGLPRNGKTLRAIAEAEAERLKTQRPVFYFGIKDLKLPWLRLEKPEAWVDVPDGSLVVIDEAQENGFPTRGPGQRAPDHVAKLATHGHRGLDLFLITQHPRMVDPHVRSLANRHLHVVRKWGRQAATIHEWSSVNDQCHKSRKDSIRHDWRYPKNVFAWYTSASEHNMKVRIPARVILFWCLPFVFAGLAWLAWSKLSTFGEIKENSILDQAGVSAGQAVGSGIRPGGDRAEMVKTAAQYVEAYAPRVQGLEYTAPAYDDITKAVQAPYPAACVVMRGECRCYSQQATRLDVPDQLCRSIVDRGFFVAWAKPPEPPKPAEKPASAPGAVYLSFSPSVVAQSAPAPAEPLPSTGGRISRGAAAGGGATPGLGVQPQGGAFGVSR